MASKGRSGTQKRKTRLSEKTLIKALRLLSRLGRVNTCVRPGYDCMDSLMGKVSHSKRILKMLSVVDKGSRRVVNADFGEGLLMNKDLQSIQQMRRCVPGIDSRSGTQAPTPPMLDRERACVEWAGLEVPVVMPSSCACGCTLLTPRTLGRYGPTGVLDATQVHVILRQDVRCQGCQKQVCCSDDDVKRHFEAKGIYPVRATIQAASATSGFHGTGSGRKAIWHTVPFITTLYHTLRQTRSLEALRMAYMNKLQGQAMQHDCFKEHTSIVLQYCFSFVPASATMRNLVQDFHKLRVSPQVVELQRCVAKRTRVYKVDGHRKAAKLVKDASPSTPKSAILPVMNEEGCLVGPPLRIAGEGRVGFRQGLNQSLDIHMEANSESSDRGALRAIGTDDYKHQKYVLGEIWLERFGAHAPCRSIACTRTRIDALEQEALNGRPGFVVFQDTKHLDIDLVHHAPNASSSSQTLHEAFAAGQARFSAPLRSDFQGQPAPTRLHRRRARWSKPARVVLEKVAKLSHFDFKKWKATDGKLQYLKGCTAAKQCLQQPTIAVEQQWLEIFPCKPPWGEIDRMARELEADLHEDALPWLYKDGAEYVAEMRRVRDWFVQVLPGTRRQVGIVREGVEENATQKIGAPHPCVTAAVLEIFQRCEQEVYIRGCMNWSYLCRCARAVGLELASGTTDLEALNKELISIFRAGQITRLGDELFKLHMDMLFLRLARRRSHAALKTIIAHGKDAISQEIAIMVETLRWFEDEDALEVAQRWQDDLNELRRSLPKPQARKTPLRRKRRLGK